MRTKLRCAIVALTLGSTFLSLGPSIASNKPFAMKARVSITVLRAMDSVARMDLNLKYQISALDRLTTVHNNLLGTWSGDITNAAAAEQNSAKQRMNSLDVDWQEHIARQRTIVSKAKTQLVAAERKLLLLKRDSPRETTTARAGQLLAWRSLYDKERNEKTQYLSFGLTDTVKDIDQNVKFAKDEIARALANGESISISKMDLAGALAQLDLFLKEIPFIRAEGNGELALTKSFLLQAQR